MLFTKWMLFSLIWYVFPLGEIQGCLMLRILHSSFATSITWCLPWIFPTGGRIDHAHHDGLAAIALLDTLALEAAVIKVMELTEEKDTLIVVTADHSHVMTIGGWPSRGNPILGEFHIWCELSGYWFIFLTYKLVFLIVYVMFLPFLYHHHHLGCVHPV